MKLESKSIAIRDLQFETWQKIKKMHLYATYQSIFDKKGKSESIRDLLFEIRQKMKMCRMDLLIEI